MGMQTSAKLVLLVFMEFGGGGVLLPIATIPPSPTPKDSREVDNLNKQAASLERVLPAGMLQKASEAYQLASEINYTAGIARSLAQMGKAHVRLGNLTEAERFLTQAQAVEHLDPLLQAEILNSRGINYIYSKVYDKAFAVYQQGLSLARSIDNKTLQAQFLNNIGEIYREHKDFATAIDYYNKSIEVHRSLPEYSRKSVPIANLSVIYLEMGDLDRAERYAQEALSVAREQNDHMIESVCLQYLGIIARKRGQREQAVEYLEASLAIYRSTKETIHATEVLLSFHELYFAAGDTDGSLRYLNEALAQAQEADSLALRLNIYKEMARVYEHIGDRDKALFYYKQYMKTMEAIDQAEREQRLRAISMQIVADESLREKEAYRQLSEELDRKAKELEGSLRTLQAISDIGKSITATLSLERIFALVHKHLQDLMPVDSFGIGLYNESTDCIEYEFLIEENKQLHGLAIDMESTDSFAVACFRQKGGLLVNSLTEDISAYVDRVSSLSEKPMQALMFQPLMLQDRCIGVMTVQSRQENVYSQKTLGLLEMLSAYLSIAVQNARHSEALQGEIKQRELAQRQLEELNQELAGLSQRDGLTNVANRRYFDQTLQQVWNAATKEQTSISLLMIDVDCLKAYNDYYGHLSGDDVIKQIAQALESGVRRSTDLVARYGGDEFVVLLPDTDEIGALQVAERIADNVANCGVRLPTSFPAPSITVSIGVATMVPDSSSQPSELIARGDYALYRAKEDGRDTICVYTVNEDM